MINSALSGEPAAGVAVAVEPHSGGAALVGSRSPGWILLAAVLLVPAVVLAVRGSGQPLWLDDVYTLAFVRADNLPELWRGILLGIDGNPPLYLTLAWLAAHAFPTVDPVVLLRLFNGILIGATLWVLFRLLRRALAWPLALTSLALFVSCNTGVVQAGMALRTYALYLLAASLALLLQVRLAETGARRDQLLLACIFPVLALSHTFGIVYVGCIAASGAVVTLLAGDRTALRRTLVAPLPALAVFVAWIPGMISQSEVARPYGWIPVPAAGDLLLTAFPSSFAAVVAVVMASALAFPAVLERRVWVGRLLARGNRAGWILLLCGCGFALFTAAVWLASQLVFPLFVVRYFTPNILVGLALVATVVAAAMDGPRRWAGVVAALAAAAVCGAVYSNGGERLFTQISCTDADGRFLEQGHVVPGLPIVTVSPHAWLPRTASARPAADYVFPLDWEVVERYPTRATNNAVDFQIMRRFRDWAHVGGIVTTADLLAQHRDFMVLDETSRAWFDHLRATRHVTATSVAATLDCRLWRVHVD